MSQRPDYGHDCKENWCYECCSCEKCRENTHAALQRLLDSANNIVDELKPSKWWLQLKAAMSNAEEALHGKAQPVQEGTGTPGTDQAVTGDAAPGAQAATDIGGT